MKQILAYVTNEALGEKIVEFLQELRNLSTDSKECKKFIQDWINSCVLDPDQWSYNDLYMSKEEYNSLPDLAKRINRLFGYCSITSAKDNATLFKELMKFVQSELGCKGWKIIARSAESRKGVDLDYIDFYFAWIRNDQMLEGWWCITIKANNQKDFELKDGFTYF